MSYMKVEGDPTTVLVNNSYSPDTTPDMGGVAMRQEVGTIPGPAYYERQRRNRAARDEFLYLMAPTSVLALVGGVRVVYRLCRWLGRGTLFGISSCLVSAWDGHRMAGQAFKSWWYSLDENEAEVFVMLSFLWVTLYVVICAVYAFG